MIERIPDHVLTRLPAHYAESHRLVPLAWHDGVLHVAHPRGTTARVLEELALLLGCEVSGEPREDAELDALIRRNYGVGAQAIESLVQADPVPAAAGSGAAPAAPTTAAGEDDAAIGRFVNRLLEDAWRDGATDLHIEPYEDRLRVRARIDGFLHEIPVPAEVRRFRREIVSRIKVLAHLDIAESRLPQDGRFRHRLAGEEHDFRVSILPTPHGEAVNLRVLANAAILRGLESLGLRAGDLEAVRGILERPHGVVLVTGPTGSGKTTTLYAFLNVLNASTRKIITIEDPIEYKLDGVTQIQVQPRIGLGFASGLRSMLRHDPDVMMVGEIRDQETAETAIRVALTGHLVFSTVHTNDAPSTPARLMDMGVEPYLAASSIECILAQRLVRLLCPQCRTPESPPEAAALAVPEAIWEALRRDASFQVARGCDACRGTGYRGRTAIFEVLPMTGEIRDLVLHREPATRVAAAARRQGFWPLRWKGLQRAAEGLTSVEEVLRVTAAESL